MFEIGIMWSGLKWRFEQGSWLQYIMRIIDIDKNKSRLLMDQWDLVRFAGGPDHCPCTKYGASILSIKTVCLTVGDDFCIFEWNKSAKYLHPDLSIKDTLIPNFSSPMAIYVSLSHQKKAQFALPIFVVSLQQITLLTGNWFDQRDKVNGTAGRNNSAADGKKQVPVDVLSSWGNNDQTWIYNTVYDLEHKIPLTG